MNDTEEYDGRLRSVFESCDRNDSGYLSLEEFGTLCSELCLEDEQLLLQKVLFRETTSKLVYEKFKEVLLRLIEGTLTDQHADQGFEPAVDYSLIQFENDSLDGESAPKNYYQSTRNGIDNNRNDTDFLDRKRRDSLGSPEAYSPGQPDSTDFHSQNALLLDFDPLFDNAKENYRKTSTPQISSLPLSLTKKYGRSSSPDESLFQDDATMQKQIRNHSGLPDQNQNLHSSAFEITMEEFTGEGRGGEWINPDSEVSKEGYGDENGVTADPHATNDAQEALASIWVQIIGGFDQKINIFQFQQLFLTQVPNTSTDDVKKLFEMLDENEDGLITFEHFSQQMSAFIMSLGEFPSTENEDASFEEPSGSNNDNSPPQNKTYPVCSSQTSPETYISTFNHSHTIHEEPRHISTFDINQSQREDNHVTSVASSAMDTPQPVKREDNRSNNEVEDPMQLYHGVPPYRRRRRSTQASIRQQRRRSSRITSLPYYHPISRQKAEECPLFFLTEENESYVRSEKIRSIFSDEGMENADKIFQDLGLGLDESFNVEVLNEAFEAELKEHPAHFALCALYKHGMNFYKSQREQEVSEKNKLESLMKHLDAQIEEQEERIEKLESDYRERVEIMENRFKSKLTRWKMKLETEQDKQEQIKVEETKQMKLQIERLKQSETKLLEELATKETEEKELLQKCSHLEDQLKTAESNLVLMRCDFDNLLGQTSLHNQEHLVERQKIDKLMHDYAVESLRFQDKNDELLRQMDLVSKRWSKYKQEERPPCEDDNLTMLLPNQPKLTSSDPSLQLSEEHSSSTPPRFVNKISITPTPTQSLSESGTWSKNIKATSTSRRSHVSTYFIKSRSVASGNSPMSSNVVSPASDSATSS